ncbi:hypothetical protein EV361DRAFT_807366, partial [Lentinula raphanica]
SPIYAFFHAEPGMEFSKSNDKPDYLVYQCTNCGEKIRQGMKTGDWGSTGNLREHVRKCWGEEALAAVKESNLDQARVGVKEFSKSKQSTLTLVINSVQAWFKIVVTARWVAKSAWPFRIVQDRSYRWLQKEGRPSHYVPSKVMVARDVKKLYVACKEKLGTCPYVMHRSYSLSWPLELDCWSSPNHWAFMSIITKMLHRDRDGKEVLTGVLLNFVELPCSHSAINMAKTIVQTLEEYGVADKVSIVTSLEWL